MLTRNNLSRMPDLNVTSNSYNFFSRMVAFENFYRGWGNLEFLGEEFNESLIRLSFNGWSSHFHFDSISIRARHLVLGRLGLKIDFQNDLFHLGNPDSRNEAGFLKGVKISNHKHQIQNKSQFPKSEIPNKIVLVIQNWCLELIWNL